jgi:putative ABC transport system permease protein
MTAPIPAWRRYLRFWGPDVASDVNDEFSFHLEMRTAELMAKGMTPAEARAAALQRIGDLNGLKRLCQSIGEERELMQQRRLWWDSLRNDVWLGVRQLVRNPVLTVVAGITLALGIGATSAISSLVYAVLLRPLPYEDSNRIVKVVETARGSETAVGPGQFTEWVKRSRALESIAAQVHSTFNLVNGGEPRRVAGSFVSPSYFQTHYIAPLLGRYFTPEEADPGRDRVVVLSEALFRQRYGGDRGMIGQTVDLNGVPHTVVGVAPSAYSLVREGDLLWVPLALTAEHKSSFDDHWLLVTAKLKPNVSLLDAQRDVERVSREIAQSHPAEMATRSARVLDFHRALVDQYDRQLVVLFGAVAFVLLLACLNVANLLLARVTVRRKEIAIRAALGAGRARIVLQLLTESMVLAALGGVLSFAVARGVLFALVRLAPRDVPRLEEAGQGLQLYLFLALMTVISGALLGLIPALRASAGDVQRRLREGGKDSARGSVRDPLRNVLVVAEIALALVLLIGAGLFVRSAHRLYRIDPGFNVANALSVRFSLPATKYHNAEQVQQAYGEIIARLRALPGVDAVAANSQLPFTGSVDVMIRSPGQQYAPGNEPFAHFRLITPNYFDAMQIPLQRGRAFTARDNSSAAPVVIVNETLAQSRWPGEDPIGKNISCCDEEGARVWREVVGVSADVRHWLTQEPLPELYVSYEQAPAQSWTWFANSLALVIRTQSRPEAVLSAVRQAIGSVDPTIPLFDVRTLEEMRRSATSANRFSMLLLSALALIALTLAAVGIYGVLSYLVSQRRHEIGVRMALGARSRDVVTHILGQGAMLAGIGILIGVPLALASTRAVGTLLYGIKPTDPLTFLLVSSLLLLVALLACYLPARRAASVDPMSALRG